MKKARSRAYPILDLREACAILTGKLAGLGDSTLDRNALAEILGYASGSGGVAARKVGCLVQYGMLERKDGHYKMSRLGHRLQSLTAGTEEFLRVSGIALERPVLFNSVLARYRPQGRVPEDLARVLTEHYGITARASKDAEGVFIRSALFAKVLDVEGRFLEDSSSPLSPERDLASPPEPQIEVAHSPENLKPPKGYPLPLTGERVARLKFPPQVSARELEILEARLLSDIGSGRLWDYLGLEKPVANPTQGSEEKQGSIEADNVVPIRPHREF